MSEKKYRLVLFSLLWVTYSSTYLIRKPLGIIKGDIAEDLKLSKLELGMLDTAMLLPYAVMQVLLGPLADRLGPRRTLVACLILGGISMSLFGLWDSYPLLLTLLFLSGTAQAPCWPACSKALVSWFPDSSARDTIFGVFGTSGFVGGICGTALAVWFQSLYGWRFVHLLPSSVLLFISVLVAVVVRSPEERSLPQTSESPETNMLEKPVRVAESKDFRGKLRAWFSLWLIPMIPELTWSVFCLKLVRYCMYMWLPLYLLDYIQYTKVEAGLMSMAFEFGGGIGSAAVGLIVTRVFQGRTLLALWVMVILSTISLLLFLLTAHWGPAANAIWLVLAGLGNCGPDSLLGGAIPARLGEKNGLGAGAALTGLVNGAGSLGAVVQGPLIGIVSQRWGWAGVFLLMILLSGLATVSLLRALVNKRYQLRPDQSIDM